MFRRTASGRSRVAGARNYVNFITPSSLTVHSRGVGARSAQPVAVEVRQAVVIGLVTLDKIAVPEAPSAPVANARLGRA
jgi:hypothetical protein